MTDATREWLYLSALGALSALALSKRLNAALAGAFQSVAAAIGGAL